MPPTGHEGAVETPEQNTGTIDERIKDAQERASQNGAWTPAPPPNTPPPPAAPYATTQRTIAGIGNLDEIFTYHQPVGSQPERYGRLRHSGLQTAEAIIEMCPPSAERTLAIRKIQEAIFWANASIAIVEKPAIAFGHPGEPPPTDC